MRSRSRAARWGSWCWRRGRIRRSAAFLGDRLTDALRADVAAARATGIGTTFSEYERGLNGISAAARDRTGHPVAYLSVTGPDYRLSASRTAEITPLLLAAARDLEQALGLTA